MYTEIITKFNDNSGFLLGSPESKCLHLENEESNDSCVEVSSQDNHTSLCSADFNVSSNSANLLGSSDKFEINENGEFNLSFEEWQNLTLTDSEGNIKCNRNWANIFAEKLSEFVPYCVLVFKIHWFSKLNSRKHNCAYFQARAYCKFDNCFHFIFVFKIDQILQIIGLGLSILPEGCYLPNILKKKPLIRDIYQEIYAVRSLKNCLILPPVCITIPNLAIH